MRFGKAWHGLVSLARNFYGVRLGKVRLGWVRPGVVRYGFSGEKFLCGSAGSGVVWRGVVRSGLVG